jgi:hypothetical protein
LKFQAPVAFWLSSTQDYAAAITRPLSATRLTRAASILNTFCCAEWFWKRQVNSYALQVEPDRFKFEDKAILDYKEALRIEKIRNEFFVRLKELLQKQQGKDESG